jgi:hypothetical protein
MTVMQENYTFSLLVNSVEYWPYLLRGSLQMTQGESSETGSLTCRLEDYDGTLNFADLLWKEVYWKTLTPSVTYIFGGYLVEVIPEHSTADTRAVWTLKCESWGTLFNRVLAVTATYAGHTAKAIVAHLFTAAGLSGFDVTTYVATGDTIAKFGVTNAKLSEALDQLAAIANLAGTGEPFIWWVTPAKALRFGLAASFAAPFGIAPLATADWTTTFPPLRDTSVGTEYGIRNKATRPAKEAPKSAAGLDRGTSGGSDGGTPTAPPPVIWF